VQIGENSKLTVHPSEPESVRKFYQDVLGCLMTKTWDAADVFQLGSAFFLGVVFDESALSAAGSPSLDRAGAAHFRSGGSETRHRAVRH
jgi:hypothetical protein